MRRPAALLMASIVGMSLLVGATPAAAAEYQADAWIKLCGLSTGCTIDPLPHPWKGRDVYNATAAKQKVAVRLEDGEGARFWVVVQNDGDQPDTLTVQGCRGTRHFTLNAVLMGKHKRPNWKARNVTKAFKQGTLSFDLPPASQGKRKVFTVNIIASTHREGISYTCTIRVGSAGRWGARDTVAAKLTTY
ncbi:MAG TPA: hypothetical protein VIC52_06100 [Actinomycetota bacterium]